MTTLDDAQKKAVKDPSRFVAILASAGSGKTRTLVARIVHAVKTERLSPSEIVAFTFTERAADELRPAFSASLMFLSSYNSIVEVIRECKRFESVYTEMEKKGLIATLKVHHRRLYNHLSFFHGSASYIVEETTDIVDNLVTAYELKEGQAIKTIFEDNVFGILRRINTHNLFQSGSQLEKQLRKRV